MNIFEDMVNAVVHISVMIATLIILYIFIFVLIDSIKSLRIGIHEKNRHDEFTYGFYAVFSVFLIIGILISSYRTLSLPEYIVVIVLTISVIIVRKNPLKSK